MALGLHPRVREGFGDVVPAFTRPMAAGVALADDPAGGDFGRARCRVIASGLVAAGTDAGPEQRLAVVHRALASEGLHPAALHLEPGNAEFSLPTW
jgi:HopA1 effector protein family